MQFVNPIFWFGGAIISGFCPFPRLAVAFIQKYGRGMADALSSVYGTAIAGESIIKITEGKLSLIDPDWSEHNKDRFRARPADLKLTPP
jgi:hypothetical protein